MELRAILHASELLTGKGVRIKDGRRPLEEDLDRIEDGALVYSVEDGCPAQIQWVGKTEDFPSEYAQLRTQDLQRKQAVIPGLIDCHTHLIFAGDRSGEFARRCAGASYEEIAAAGGGILSTIQPTREATLDELVDLAVPRVKEMEGYGLKTIEVKSGYGLSSESEMKSLRAIPQLRQRFPHLTFPATFLGAHAFPPDQSRDTYLKEILEAMLPQVVEEKLAESCDVFIDRGYYTLGEGREILTRAQELGLKIKIHGDELANTESAAMAVELGALSVDHLLQVSQKGIQALAGSQKTVAVLLPGTAFYLKAPYAPARELIDAGACVALSTDFNPGSSMCASLPAVMTLGALYMGMSRAEVFASVTYNAAKALDLHDRKGTLDVGRDADFTVLPFSKFEEIYYRFAWSPVG